MAYYLAFRKKEMLPFGTTWMNLEGIVLSERSQTHTERHIYMTSHTSESKPSHTQKKRVQWWLPGAGPREKWRSSGQRVQNFSYAR